jgi:small-conductance mechanosensitive channel
MHELVAHFVARWAMLYLGAGLVVAAFLVNRFAPKRKQRIRRVVMIFVLYVLACAGLVAARVFGAHAWVPRFSVASDLLEAFTTINLGALVIFEVFLPALKIDVPTIAGDLAVGAAYLVATLGTLRNAGMDLSGVIATSAVVSGVLALSLQTTLGNILGGVALQLDGSIHAGEWIQLADGTQGKVREIRWRHTVVETRNWDTIIVPNATLLGSNILLLGKREGASVPHRMWVYFCVDFRYPPSTVIAVVTEALAAPIPRVAAEPKPNVVCMDLAKDYRESYAYYGARYWLTDLAVDDPTSSLVRARIHAALKRAGIPLAHPTTTQFIIREDERYEEKREQRHKTRSINALTGLELFHSLTEAERDELATHLCFVPFAAGETMTRQGAVAHYLYVLSAGKAEVVTSEGKVTKKVADLEGPTFFGEMGLMTGEPRQASVIAISDTECYRLDKSGFESILHARPEIADAMSVTLAKRRVELIAVREGLDTDAQKARQVTEQRRILARIQDFFGLDDGSGRPSRG